MLAESSELLRLKEALPNQHHDFRHYQLLCVQILGMYCLLPQGSQSTLQPTWPDILPRLLPLLKPCASFCSPIYLTAISGLVSLNRGEISAKMYQNLDVHRLKNVRCPRPPRRSSSRNKLPCSTPFSWPQYPNVRPYVTVRYRG